MGLDPITLNQTAYNLLMDNVSVIKASYTVYTSLIGVWFWAIMLIFLLVVTYLKTEDLTYVVIFGIMGSVGLAINGLLPDFMKTFIYITLALGIALTLYAFFIRRD